MQKLQGIESIKEVHATFGTYDILTKIETPSFTRKKVTMIHVITGSWFVGEPV